MSSFPSVTDCAVGLKKVTWRFYWDDVQWSDMEDVRFYQQCRNKAEVNAPKGRKRSYQIRKDHRRDPHIAGDISHQTPFCPLSQIQKMRCECWKRTQESSGWMCSLKQESPLGGFWQKPLFLHSQCPRTCNFQARMCLAVISNYKKLLLTLHGKLPHLPTAPSFALWSYTE